MPRCKNCKDKFEPKKFNWKYCEKEACNDIGIKELLEKSRQQKKRQWNKQKRAIKESLKTHSDWLKDLEAVFNKFIRLRDKDKGCVSCDKKAGQFKLTAGHFWNAGNYSFLRFNEWNVHGQCWFDCNKNKHGNVNEYRLRITERITKEQLKWLDDNRHNPQKLTIEEIKEKIKEYKEKIKKFD